MTIHIDWRALARALAIGAAGGSIFAWFNLPLAWMMGAMCLTTLSAIGGVAVKVPPSLRMIMIAVLGVMLGSAFHPDIIESAGQWSASLAMLFFYVAVVALLGGLYFRKVAKYDATTAYFSAIPGGLSEMILVGGSMGGDDRSIALTHASRILLVVLIIPFWFRLVEGYEPAPGGVSSSFMAFVDIPAADLVILALCAVIGFFVARACRLPAAALTGPMVISAAVHLFGLTTSKPPSELIIIAQIVIGTAIGCRFAGVGPRRVLRALVAAGGATAIMLGIGVLFSLGLHAALGLPVAALVLAFAPGGLAEMTLIALALGVDPAFVSTHHVVRIFLVVILAPLAFKMIAPRIGIGRAS
ncbi:MAG: AbrB family transcriptional regulator [Alphaproteobacteria bacterium]|jgi:membrane AbrB-like protein